MTKTTFYSFMAVFFFIGAIAFADTKLSPNAEAKKTKSADGKALIYEISYPVVKSETPQISAIRIRVENEKATAFDLEWSPAPDNSKLKGVVTKRTVTSNFRRFMEAVRETSPSSSLELSSFITPPGRYYSVKTSEPLLSKLPMKVSTAEKEELKKEWDGYFFGFENGNADLFKTDGKTTTLKASEALADIKSDSTYGDHNAQALQSLQDQATFIAQALEAYGTKTKGFDKNKIQFDGFPKKLPPQSFELPDFIKGGIEQEVEKLSTTTTETPKRNNRK